MLGGGRGISKPLYRVFALLQRRRGRRGCFRQPPRPDREQPVETPHL